jgi:hypothetical protein
VAEVALRTRGSGAPEPYTAGHLCRSARGIALVRTGRAADVHAAIGELCAELAPQELWGARRTLLFEPTIDLLAGAVAAGFEDVEELSTTAALEPLRDELRSQALTESLTAGVEGR